MSPVNSDDASGEVFGRAGQPLTRKELRAQQQVQGAEGEDVIPPRVVETGEDAPPADAPPADAPDQPAAAPTVHDDPVHVDPVHGYAGGGAREDVFHSLDDVLDHDPPHDAQAHEGHAVHPDSDARYVYHEADSRPAEDHEEEGHVVLAGGAAIPTPKGPSQKVRRRRRRFLALLLTLSVFVVAIVVGAQFLKPLLGGDAASDYPGPGTGEVSITVPRAPGRSPWRPSSRTRTWWRTPTRSCGNSWPPVGRWRPETSPCATK